ncbi:NUDIX hydrolase [Granulicoccus phenolivorans]|uniref:NUDIX hydrolase n=1 Tax=Granulicoccus phenolivorans TaxID=266854 RepID=UPI0003F6DCB0|nr:CoA pyrophosphatase [Granulicoccus phenolivorans]
MSTPPAWLEQAPARLWSEFPAWFADFTPPPQTTRRSAVLMLFGEGPGGVDVLLTERARSLRRAPGQVAFPGGGTEPGDADATATALREAWEEVGVTGVRVLAELPQLYLTPLDDAVTPVVGWWPAPTELVPDPIEVGRAARVPVAELLDPANRFMVRGDWGETIGFAAEGLFIWGFTAGLLDHLFSSAGVNRPWDRERTLPLPTDILATMRRGR